MAHTRFRPFATAFIAVLALTLSACGGSSEDEATSTTTAAPAANTATTAAAQASGTDYCTDVKAALALKPADGEITPAMERQHANYAVAVGKVVESAPASQKPFWTATQKLAASIADGKTDDPANAQFASQAFGSIGPVAQSVQADCNINILE